MATKTKMSKKDFLNMIRKESKGAVSFANYSRVCRYNKDDIDELRILPELDFTIDNPDYDPDKKAGKGNQKTIVDYDAAKKAGYNTFFNISNKYIKEALEREGIENKELSVDEMEDIEVRDGVTIKDIVDIEMESTMKAVNKVFKGKEVTSFLGFDGGNRSALTVTLSIPNIKSISELV